jgi:formamidopyrimidine-DNA glycosylase
MPELPDLIVFAESLQGKVLNKEISDAVYHKTKRLNVAPGAFADALKKRKIAKVRRVGKALLFELDSGDSFLAHLMLSGGFKVGKQGEEVASAVLTVDFSDGQSMVFFDPRGLATITLNPDLKGHAVDALEITRDHLESVIKKKPDLTIKEILIDQSAISGIGNAYSDEILWHAKISPKSLAGKLPDKAKTQLVTSIHQVLKSATDYLRKNNPGIMSGEEREHLAVHKPKAKLSPTGSAIKTEEIAGKKTYFTEEQILYK